MLSQTILYILIYVTCLNISTLQAASSSNDSCGPLMFDCGDHNCIPRSWRCDGDTDCLNGNDEKSCEKQEHVCDSDQFYKCREPSSPRSTIADIRLRAISHLFPSSCIPKNWTCDGEFDCPERDDEENCANVKCGEGQFKCPGFQQSLTSCIPMSWVCDGQSDCLGMEDEKNCTLSKDNATTCDPDEFRCKDGQCIFSGWKCDGEFDCSDKTDEDVTFASCNATVCDPTTHFKCTSTDFCLPNPWRCDGQPDCPDHSDEKNCSDMKPHHNVTCKSDEFQCHNRAECIRQTWVCDTDEDCSDGSDEKDCTPERIHCGVDEVLCDGICKDHCGTLPTRAPVKECNNDTQYQCPDTSCIDLSKLCSNSTSGANDCSPSVCENQIMRCDKKDSAFCYCRGMGSGGNVCYCPAGFERVGNSCVDINECERYAGICDQICTNLIPNYKCDCHAGFKLTAGPTTDGGIEHRPSKCRAVGDDPLLLLSNRVAIRQYDLVTNRYQPIVNQLDSAVAMDFWHENSTLIWSDVSKEKIMICQMKHKTDTLNQCVEGGSVTLIDKNVSTPDGLAVDWVHGLLFWTDTGLDTINVYDLVNKKRKILFNESLEEPRAIAVDPSAGLIFWTDWGSKPRIERAGMDGNDRAIVISNEAVQWPNGLAVDIYEKRIYWADAKTKTISSCDYWGKNVKTVLHNHALLKHPFSLAVFEEKLYWTDWDHEGVLAVNKFNGENVKTVMNGVPGPMTVRIYHKVAQPKQINKCETHQCDHLCLPKAYVKSSDPQAEAEVQGLPYSCGCDMGFKLDGLTKCTAEGFIADAIAREITGDNTASDNALMVFFVGGLIVSALLIAGYTYRQKRFARFTSLNFDNPIYRRTVEDTDGELEILGDNSVGAIPANPTTQEPRLILSNSVAAQYNRDQAAYMDNDPFNDHRGLY